MFGITIPHKPHNYYKIDNFVSRSARPDEKGIKWLKRQGVNNIIDFCIGHDKSSFNEKDVVEKCGMHYYNIPTDPFHPQEKQVGQFLDLVEGIKEKGEKVHIHCKHGADRTGMYSWIYKQKNGIGTMEENRLEMIRIGHNSGAFPKMMQWIIDYLYKGWI